MTTYLDKVNENHKPMLITRRNGSSAVLVSLDDFHSIQETLYLMQSPENAKRLNKAMAEIEKGTAIERELIESDK